MLEGLLFASREDPQHTPEHQPEPHANPSTHAKPEPSPDMALGPATQRSNECKHAELDSGEAADESLASAADGLVCRAMVVNERHRLGLG